MTRTKKNETYLNVCVETSIYEQLNNFCAEGVQNRTVAVERVLIDYLEDYKNEQQMLSELEVNNG